MNRVCRLAVLLSFACLLLATLQVDPAMAKPGRHAPLMEIQTGRHDDRRVWKTRIEDDTAVRRLVRKVPTGSGFDDWREMLEEEVHYTPSTLTNYLKIWLFRQKAQQSDLQVLEHVHGPAATLYIYRVPSQGLIAVRKFMQAPDGIYMIAYLAQEQGIDYTRYAAWLKAIETAVLVQRPASNKRP